MNHPNPFFPLMCVKPRKSNTDLRVCSSTAFGARDSMIILPRRLNGVTNSEQASKSLDLFRFEAKMSAHKSIYLVETHMQRVRLSLGPCFLAVFLFSSALACLSQTATVLRGSNLRKAPNTSSTILETLKRADSVTLIASRKRSGYYHVSASDGTVGWVLAKNVSTSGPSAGPGSSTGTGSSPGPGDLVGQLAAASVKAVPQPLVINGQSVCGPTGDASDAKTQALDANKNRTDIPNPGSYIPAGWNALANLPSTQPDQLQGAPVEVEGYLSHRIQVESSGKGESTNCHLTNLDEVDWHMYLTNQPAQGIAGAIIVETTPRTRPLHSWDQNTLSKLIDSNTKVRISGWLMYDWQHIGVIGKQRVTVWEVHPVTRIETQDSGGNWQNVEGP
jgi:Bacterial SH3 domain